LPIDVEAVDVLIVVALGIVLAAIAAIYPARRAAR
jgi:ABC-type lipoprotein release transport system permease subunit